MSTALMSSIADSNLSRSEKESLISRMYGQARSFGHGARRGLTHGLSTVRASSEAGVTGLALGLFHAEIGLDLAGKVPLDLGLAFLGIGTAAFSPGEDFADDAKNVGNAALTTFFFRQGYAFMAEKKMQNGGVPTPFKSLKSVFHGDEFGDEYGAEDPVLNAAREL